MKISASLKGQATSVSFERSLILAGAALLLWAPLVRAQGISYDPYADSVSATSPVVADASNALGAPNNTSAQLVGPGASLTLDMGQGEEGTQTLRLYLGQINAQVNIDVAFLDANKAVISSENRQLGIDLKPVHPKLCLQLDKFW